MILGAGAELVPGRSASPRAHVVRSGWRRPIHPLPTLNPPASDVQVAALLRAASRLAEQLQATAHMLDHEGAVPVGEVQLLTEAGLLAAPVPRDLGGLGLGTE